jgi:enoyl-CoA hydratase
VYTQIRYERDEPLATIVLNRPHVRNALSAILRDELDDAFATAADDDDIRVIILSAEGDHFSSGHDLGTTEERQDAEKRRAGTDIASKYRYQHAYNVENTLRWRDLPKPTIAAIQGYCIFGAWIVASAMDLIVASDDARFLAGPVQYFSLPWDTTPRKAKELLLTNRMLSATEALELGLVNSVVARADLDAETRALALKIAELDPFMARMIKKSVNEAQDIMGFRNAVQTAYSNYLILQASGSFGTVDPDQPRLRNVRSAADND